MKTQAIEPACIDFGANPGAAPRSVRYDDLGPPQADALPLARHVFLHGNGLPGRWAGRAHFVVLETGFGLGHNFLATWDAWRQDPARCERLFFVSVERHPLTADDLARAHAGSALPALAAALLQAWPPLTPNLHMLEFEGGGVQLLLALGDVAALLPGLRLQADAFYLDGFDAAHSRAHPSAHPSAHPPTHPPAMWQPRVIKALGALAAPGATAASWNTGAALHANLRSAGFEVQLAPVSSGQRDITQARWAPRFTPHRRPDAAAPGRDAVVVGAGLAGAAAARALARVGMTVTVLERHPEPAAEASGNLAGLFHGTLNADDGPYARLFRAAALQAHQAYAQALAESDVAGSAEGLLRLDLREGGHAEMQALLQALGLPPSYVQALTAEAASQRAGVALAAPAWHYPGGGWVAPSAWVRHALQTEGVRFIGGVDVQTLRREGDVWQLRDGACRVLAQAPTVVLANAASATRLLVPLGHAPWPLHHTRGQVTHWRGATALRLPVAGDGYAIPLRNDASDGSVGGGGGGGSSSSEGLLCGATRETSEPGDATLRDADHQLNVQRLHRLTGLQPPSDPAKWQGRAGWRLHADDRLPIAGALPCASLPQGLRLDQARLLPRERGLFVLTALGARGLTLAPLLARLVAAQATGTPWPLEQDLADAVDPGRWLVRAARTAGRHCTG